MVGKSSKISNYSVFFPFVKREMRRTNTKKKKKKKSSSAYPCATFSSAQPCARFYQTKDLQLELKKKTRYVCKLYNRLYNRIGRSITKIHIICDSILAFYRYYETVVSHLIPYRKRCPFKLKPYANFLHRPK